MDSPDGRSSLLPDRAGWILIAGLALLYCWNLGRVELSVTDECRSAVIVRDMVEGGRWLLPRTPDGLWTEKPIAYYGMAAALGSLFGINEWTLRLVSVGMGVATLLLTWILARLYGSPRAARIAVAALAANILFIGAARDAMVDMTLAFFLTAGLTAHFAARLGRLAPMKGAVLAGIAFGLATLSKGPIGIVLPIAVAGGDAILEHRGRFWRAAVWWKEGLVTVAIAAAIACAWYVPGYLRDGMPYLNNSLLDENLWMPLGKAKRQGVSHYKSPLYYFGIQLAAVLPMLPLLPTLIGWARDREAGLARRHLLAWLGFGFLLFEIASNKRMYYLIPLQPAVAVMIGLAAERALGGDRRLLRITAKIAAGSLALAALGATFIAMRPAALASIREGTVASAVLPHRIWIIAFAALFLYVAVQLYKMASGDRTAMIQMCGAFGLAIAAARFGVGDRFEAEFNRTRPFVAQAAPKMAQGGVPVILPPIRGYSIDFYWPTRIVRDRTAALQAEYVFVARAQLKEIAEPRETLGTWKYGSEGRDDVLLLHRTSPR